MSWKNPTIEEVERITKILLKRKMKVYSQDNKKIQVFWECKGKVKFGTINKDYFHRYGPSVMISLTIGSRNPWFCSNDVANSIDPKIVDLIKSGQYNSLPDFDIRLLNSLRD